MRRGMAVLASLGLVLAACGGDDSDDGAATAVESVEESEAESESESGETVAETDESTADSDADSDTGDDDAGDAADDGGDDDGGTVIRSFDDIPQECRDSMAEFLREIEPIVGDVDWQTATLADFETIGAEFDEISGDFEAENAANGCDDMVFADDDDEFRLLIDFAREEAPGTVGFFEFLSSFAPAAEDMVGSADGGGDDEDAGGTDGFADCDAAVSFMEQLMADYDSFLEVPAAELMRFSALGTVIGTCSPEQMEFFDSDEFNNFVSE